ncbi:hypothetical protein WMY93_001900 [Mugilogobius chulae]|uniref:Uncharacterized protein n=1 Tax=Mugilogobius chulae TaxID=88201 RepID=A0AAW0PUT5_9GOBI
MSIWTNSSSSCVLTVLTHVHSSLHSTHRHIGHDSSGFTSCIFSSEPTAAQVNAHGHFTATHYSKDLLLSLSYIFVLTYVCNLNQFYEVSVCLNLETVRARSMGNQVSERAPGSPFLPGLQSPLHVVVVGVDGAGKTSLLYRLTLQDFVEAAPTKGFNTERVRLSGGALYQVWDVGGQDKLRPLWKAYARRTHGLVFVVDAADPERLDEAKVELHRMARCPESQGVPILLLANKQDLPGALTPAQVDKACLSTSSARPRCTTHRPAPLWTDTACSWDWTCSIT